MACTDLYCDQFVLNSSLRSMHELHKKADHYRHMWNSSLSKKNDITCLISWLGGRSWKTFNANSKCLKRKGCYCQQCKLIYRCCSSWGTVQRAIWASYAMKQAWQLKIKNQGRRKISQIADLDLQNLLPMLTFGLLIQVMYTNSPRTQATKAPCSCSSMQCACKIELDPRRPWGCSWIERARWESPTP